MLFVTQTVSGKKTVKHMVNLRKNIYDLRDSLLSKYSGDSDGFAQQ